MNEITCSVIKDLLPLYADGVVSEDTRRIVAEHLENCSDCRKIYENMTSQVAIPIESAKPLKNFKQSWRKKKIVIALTSVIITLTIVFSGYLVYANVGVVHDFFSPKMLVNMRNEEPFAEWQQLKIGESGYLNFDSIFYSKEIVLDANSSTEAVFRIFDQAGNLVLDNLTLEPGTSVPLDSLERNTNYLIEVKSTGEAIFVNFF